MCSEVQVDIRKEDEVTRWIHHVSNLRRPCCPDSSLVAAAHCVDP